MRVLTRYLSLCAHRRWIGGNVVYRIDIHSLEICVPAYRHDTPFSEDKCLAGGKLESAVVRDESYLR